MMTVNFTFPRFHTPTFVTVLSLTFLAFSCLLAGNASAQYDFPRLGLSAVPDDYVGEMSAEIGDTFTVYAGVYGSESGIPLDEDILSLSWTVHQVCCGADLIVVDHEFVGDFVSEGHPLAGVTSLAPSCVSADFIPLAVLRVLLLTPDGPGDYLMSGGPYAPSENCDGESPIFMEGVIMVSAWQEETAPVVGTTWSDLKSYYR